jgi:hypothetical protein
LINNLIIFEMKKLLFLIISILSLVSCSGDTENSNTNANNQEWKFKINGVQHQWIGDSTDPMSWGSSIFIQENNSVKIELTGLETDPIIDFVFRIPNLSLGSYVLNTPDKAYLRYLNLFISYYAENNEKIILTITESNENLIKGTFSGKLKRYNNQDQLIIINVTEGYFKAIRQ